jgi:hypothetical protein
MPRHSRSKNGVLKNAYVPGIHVLLSLNIQGVDDRDKPGHDVFSLRRLRVGNIAAAIAAHPDVGLLGMAEEAFEDAQP